MNLKKEVKFSKKKDDSSLKRADYEYNELILLSFKIFLKIDFCQLLTAAFRLKCREFPNFV